MSEPMNLPEPHRPEVPTFNELDTTTQARALDAVAELSQAGRQRDRVRLVDENQLPAATRAKVDALTAAGYRIVVNEGTASEVAIGDRSGSAPPRRRLGRPAGAGQHFRAALKDAVVYSLYAPVLAVVVVGSAFFIGAALAVILLAGVAILIACAAGMTYSATMEMQPAKRYRLSDADTAAITEATIETTTGATEVQLTRIAQQIAQEITALPAWSSDYLAGQRLTFDPAADADEIATHARRIAIMRHRVGEIPDGDAAEHRAARAAVEDHHKILDTLTDSLYRRVAALWAYHQHLTELDSRLTALRSLESSITLSPELDALVQQIGTDQIATDRIAGHIEETRALATQVEQLVNILQSTLAPRVSTGEVEQ